MTRVGGGKGEKKRPRFMETRRLGDWENGERGEGRGDKGDGRWEMGEGKGG